MNITEKAAYLKGLAEGIGLDDSTKEAKVLKAVLDIIDDMALIVSDLDDEVAVMADQLDAVDEDLDELEEYVYCDCEDEDCDCDCDCCCDDDEIYEVECPACGHTVYFGESVFEEEEVSCPECGAVFEDLFIDEDDCDCDCDD